MDGESPVSEFAPPPSTPDVAPSPSQRATAFIQVVLCSDFPTQILVLYTFISFGYGRDSQDIGFLTAVLLVDTILLLGLITLFVRADGGSVVELLTGGRPLAPEIRLGVPLTLAAFGVGAAAIIITRIVAPWLHNVDQNPLPELIHTRLDAVLFAFVAVFAGGVREEAQRAFLLSRFEHALGGRTVGVIVTSIAFGVGHRLQGDDAAVATGLLGAFWALIYLRRRSAIAPMVSHSGFNLLQLAQLLVVRQ